MTRNTFKDYLKDAILSAIEWKCENQSSHNLEILMDKHIEEKLNKEYPIRCQTCKHFEVIMNNKQLGACRNYHSKNGNHTKEFTEVCVDYSS